MPDENRTAAATPEQLKRSAELSANASYDAPRSLTDRYELRELLAKGGMGAVHSAWDKAFDRAVAVKLIHDHLIGEPAIKRFRHEARIAGQLQHPNIPPVYDLGKFDGDKPYLAMKLVKGRTLDDHIKQPGGDTPNLVAVFEAIAQAIGYAHSRGVIHRDLKPQNVMVGAFGEVQVMDWGLAKVQSNERPRPVEGRLPSEHSSTVADGVADPDATTGYGTRIGAPDTADDSRTSAGSILGSPAYMPPEQARGEVDRITERSDVFGLGAILCTILTGQSVFGSGSAEQARRKAAAGDVTDAFARLEASAAEPELIALAKRCLAPDPADRFANGTEVANETARIRAEADERAKQAELDRTKAEADAHAQRKRRKVLTWSAAIVFVVLVAGMIGTGVGMYRADQARQTATAKTKEVKDTLAVVQQRTKLAMDAYGDFVFGIQNQLENRPGTQDLRKTLLENARTGLAKILTDARKLGHPDETLVASQFLMGDVELQLGNTPAAMAEYQVGHDLVKGLSDVDPQNHRLQRDLSVSYNKLGDASLRLGRTAEAMSFYRQSLAITERLAAANPNDTEAQRDLGVNYNKLGNVSLQQGLPAEAAVYYRQYKALTERLAASDPKNAVIQRDLSYSYNNLGDVTLQLGQSADAANFFQKSVDERERLVAADPENTGAQRDLSVGYDKLGDVTLQLGKPAEAAAFYRRSLAIDERLAAADPKNAGHQRDLSISYNKLGEATLQLGKPVEAAALFRQSLALDERLAAADPKNTGLQRDLSVSYDKLGDVTLQLGQPAEAATYYRQSLALFERLAVADPNDAVAQRDLSVGYDKLGDANLQLGQSAEAANLFRKSLAVRERIAAADPKNAVAQRDLSVSSEKLGDVFLQLGQPVESMTFYRQSLAVRQRIAEADPKNTQAHTDLFVSFFKIGNAEKARHEYANAAVWFEKGRKQLLPWHQKKLLVGQFQNAVLIVETDISECRDAEKVIADPDFAYTRARAQIPGLVATRVKAQLHRNMPTEAVATAKRFVSWAETQEELREGKRYEAARLFALCAAAAQDDRDLLIAETIALLRNTRPSTRFVPEWIARIREEADFDGIRTHSKFAAFLRELEAPREAAPAARERVYK
ncbi:MAG: tetratricopeptide repeat protein [Gemmataceae bacterium]|nr:tetratricopeptide repeat protein [Gemmataceae bacterium]